MKRVKPVKPNLSDGAADYFRQKDLAVNDAVSPVDNQIAADIAAAKESVKEAKHYDDKNLEALALGAARGVIPGADVIATKVLGIPAEEVSKIKEYNPDLSTASEAGAFLTSLAVGSPASLAGAAVAGEKVLQKALGKALLSAADKSATKRIVSKAIEKGLPSAASGAALGVNELLNESAIGNTDLTGENLVAFAGSGALLGGLAGGAFGVGEALYKPTKNIVDAGTGQLKKAFKREVDPLRAISELAEELPARRINAYDELRSIGRTAEESTAKVQEYATNRWGIKAVNEDVESMLRKNSVAGKKIQEELVSSYKAVDDLVPALVMREEFGEKLAQGLYDFKDKNRNMFDGATAKNAFKNIGREVLEKINRTENMSATELWDLAKYYGKKGKDAFKDPKDGPLKAKLYAQLYSSTRSLLMDKIASQTANSALDGIAQKIFKLNDEFRIWNVLDKGLKKRGSTASFVNFKDAMLTLATGATAGPVAAAGALMSKKILDSDLRRRVVVLGAAQKATENFEKRVSSSFKTFFEKAPSGGKISQATRLALVNSGLSVNSNRKPAKSEKEAFSNMRSKLTEYATDPEKLAMKVAGSTIMLNSVAPEASAHAREAMARGVQFLISKMPRDARSGTNMFGDDEYEPSSLELSKFKRYVQTVENPYSTLEDLKDGTLTREHVEALSTVYPAIYEKLQQEALVYISKRPKLDYSRKIQIGILLDIPVDASLAPKHVALLQSQFAAQGQLPGQSQPMPTGAVKPTVGALQDVEKDVRTSTGMQEAQAGIED